MMPGRFFIGVGSGENLNEHIVGQKWPPTEVRQKMLEEALGVIRLLWKGGIQSHRGRYFTVENARLYALPEKAPPIYVAAGGVKMSELAARIGDGLVTAGDEEHLIKAFNSAGGKKKPKYAQLTACCARTEQEARQIAREWWPTAGSVRTRKVSSGFRNGTSYLNSESKVDAQRKASRVTVGFNRRTITSAAVAPIPLLETEGNGPPAFPGDGA
jgi:G6PDH family F420-dependent oxidoreductase